MRLTHAQRQTLERQDARYSGLPVGIPAAQDAVMAHLRIMARLLKDRRFPSPCSRAVNYVNALYERSIPEAAKKGLACRQGCAHCCYQPVIVYAPELFLLAAHIRNQEGMVEKILQAAKTTPGTQDKKYVACPLLEENACTAYAARPLSCHAFVSLDVNDCISAFRYLSAPKIHSPGAYNILRDMCRMMLWTAMKAAGHPVHGYELNSASLAAILNQDDAEKRWLRNEDVLAGLPIIPPDFPASVQAKVDRMSLAIAPAL